MPPKRKTVKKVKKLPKHAKAGTFVDVEVPLKGGGTRLQRFKAQDQTAFKMVKNPKKRYGM
jgi:hypothetical protein